MRLSRLILRLYPASLRNEYGGEMCAVFARRLQDARPLGRVLVWADACADTVVNAARAHAELTAAAVRDCVRTLMRAPAFAVTAILVTALGIGATTASFSITDHVLIRA